MLSWFSKLFERRAEKVEPRVTEPAYKVVFDERVIALEGPDRSVESITWADLGSVEVITTAGGPIEVDLFWVLTDKTGRRGPVVPMGARGEHQLVKAMQMRLAGFDNMAVIEAMSSTNEAHFPVWPPANDLT